MIAALQPDLFAASDDDASGRETIAAETVRVLYRCRQCEHRSGHARLWRVTFRHTTDRTDGFQHHLWTNADGTTHRSADAPTSTCRGCQRPTRGAVIRGHFSAAHRCDSRCIYAKGPDCECSCGSANHGAGHGR